MVEDCWINTPRGKVHILDATDIEFKSYIMKYFDSEESYRLFMIDMIIECQKAREIFPISYKKEEY